MEAGECFVPSLAEVSSQQHVELLPPTGRPFSIASALKSTLKITRATGFLNLWPHLGIKVTLVCVNQLLFVYGTVLIQFINVDTCNYSPISIKYFLLKKRKTKARDQRALIFLLGRLLLY